MKNIISILFLSMIFASCEKTISLNYKDNQPKVVIEGNITNEAGPYFVKVTKSLSLSSTDPYPTINNAVVTISDNAGNTETLSPQGNGLYQTNTLVGTIGRTYTLTVTADNQTYTAQSTMPQRVPFDSIKVEALTFAGETEYSLIPVYTDPIAKGNSYRFLLSVNNIAINQHLIQNDDVRNGLVNTRRLDVNDDKLKLKQGDLVTLKMQCIDSKVALYYNTLALMADNGPGGGTTPSNPQSNLSNGALGLFSAHTVETKSVTIK